MLPILFQEKGEFCSSQRRFKGPLNCVLSAATAVCALSTGWLPHVAAGCMRGTCRVIQRRSRFRGERNFGFHAEYFAQDTEERFSDRVVFIGLALALP